MKTYGHHASWELGIYRVKKLQWNSVSNPWETKLMNHLGRLWISSLRSCVMRPGSAVGLLSLKTRLSKINSSGLAFLNKPPSVISTSTGKNWLPGTFLLFWSSDVPWECLALALDWECCGICPCGREYGLESQ